MKKYQILYLKDAERAVQKQILLVEREPIILRTNFPTKMQSSPLTGQFTTPLIKMKHANCTYDAVREVVSHSINQGVLERGSMVEWKIITERLIDVFSDEMFTLLERNVFVIDQIRCDLVIT